MIHYDKCPVCDSSGIHKVLTATDHTFSQSPFEIWQCAQCSLRFTQDVPPANEIGKYYRSENYISHSDTNKGVINKLYHRVRKYTLGIKHKFVVEQTGKKAGVILDVGAGTGAFLHYMSQNGWKTEGLEPDENAIARARTQYGLELRSANDLFNLDPGAFDAITLWHVLEHVHDLHGYMRKLKELLNSNGRLFIAVPNYTSFDAEEYTSWWAAYDVPRHLYHFSPAAMQELTARHGFAIQKIQPMWFDSFYVSLLSEKYRKNRAALMKGFITGIRSNTKALANKRRASSLIYVLSRQ